MKPVIRPMGLDDIDEVHKIEQEVFPDPWSRASFEFEVIGNRFSLPVVLELEKKIIGYAVVWRIFEEFHIANICIRPEYQGQGWGKFLLEAILNMAEREEYALLEVREHNERAIRLYEKFGFERVGFRKHYYRNGENAIVMRKWLKRSQKNQKDVHSEWGEN